MYAVMAKFKTKGEEQEPVFENHRDSAIPKRLRFVIDGL
jgi:hypothetical protein